MLTSFNLLVIMFLRGAHSACETRVQGVYSIYRAGNTNDDFLTTSQAEMIVAIPAIGFYYRGVVGYLWSSMPATNGISFYRYFTNNIGHFYTTSATVVDWGISVESIYPYYKLNLSLITVFTVDRQLESFLRQLN